MNKTPKLRFNEFSGDWESNKLSNYTDKITTKNKNFLVTNVISNSAKHGLVSQRDYFDKDIANQNNIDGYYIVENGDFVYNPRKSLESPYGPVNRYKLEEAGVVSPLYLCFRINEKVNGKFLEYYFKSSKWYRFIYQNSDQGARYDRVSIKDAEFFKLDIKLPSQSEQYKIANFLCLIDEKISLQSEKLESLKDYKKGIMKKIFSRELRFKEDDGRDYPEWNRVKMRDITVKVGPRNKENKTYEVYSINNKVGFIPQSEQFEDSRLDNLDKSLYKIIKKGEFAYNPARINVGSIGVLEEDKTVIVSSLYVCFKFKNNLNYRFFKQYFSYSKFNKDVIRNTEGSVREYLFYENFSNIKVNVPSIKEQTKIANILECLDHKINKEEEKLYFLNEYKKGLLQQIFI